MRASSDQRVGALPRAPYGASTRETAGGMIARGHTYRAVSEALGVSSRTLETWRQKDAAFAQGYDAAIATTAEGAGPLQRARAVYLDALTARRDSGEDWGARLKAADRLI